MQWIVQHMPFMPWLPSRTKNRRRARKKKKNIIYQVNTVTHPLISRAITVATYALCLECGHMLVLPMWLRIISAYSVASLVPTLLPNAHGDNCRVFTTISAGTLAAIFASLAVAVGVSVVLSLCPTRMLWWPNDEETDTVTSLLREVLKWMDAHDDVLPAIFKHPTPQQKEESNLKYRFKNYKQRISYLTDAQRSLQEEINRRTTSQKVLNVLEEVACWSAKHNHELPARSAKNKEENNLAKKLRRLQDKEDLTPILLRRLADLLDKSQNTSTKATARGAIFRHPRRRRNALLFNQAEEHRDWCRLHYSALTPEQVGDLFGQGRSTCEPPSSARCAVQSNPTSKRRRLVGKQVPPEVR